MKNSSKRLFVLLMLFVAVTMFSMLTVTAITASTPQTQTNTDNGVQFDVKYKKVSTNKIIFNGNGGKIGTKKSVAINVKKGAKIKKLPAAPKRKGYIFQGWYTKKSGGTKISKDTKPTTSVTYFAQWKKGSSSVSTGAQNSLLGAWGISPTLPINEVREWIEFKKDGTFKYYLSVDRYSGANYRGKKVMNLTGNYRVSDNKIHVSNQFVSVKDDMIPQSNGITRQSNSYWLYKFSKSSYHDYYGSGQYFDVNWLEINMYPKDKGVLNKYVKYTKPFKR